MSSTPVVPPSIPRYFPKFLHQSLHEDYFQELWVQHLERPDAAPRSIPAAAIYAVQRSHGYSMAGRMKSKSPLREVPCSGQVRYESAGPDQQIAPLPIHELSHSRQQHVQRLKENLPVTDWAFVDHVALGRALPVQMDAAAKTRARRRILRTIDNLERTGDVLADGVRSLFDRPDF